MSKKTRTWLMAGTIIVWLSFVLVSCAGADDWLARNICCGVTLFIFPMVFMVRMLR